MDFRGRLAQFAHTQPGSFPQKRGQSTAQPNAFLNARLAFPNNQHPPPQSSKLTTNPTIASDIPRKLGGPAIHARSRHGTPRLAMMAVPEAAVDEDDLAARWEDGVGTARQS